MAGAVLIHDGEPLDALGARTRLAHINNAAVEITAFSGKA